MSAQDRVKLIQEKLTAALQPEKLEIEDQSHLHRGHAGAKAGGGHYAVMVVSVEFDGKTQVARHRLVYDALGPLMRPDTIHALSIVARTPQEIKEG